jgi:hypothetical protein
MDFYHEAAGNPASSDVITQKSHIRQQIYSHYPLKSLKPVHILKKYKRQWLA